MSATYPELYTEGTRVWIKHPEQVWQCATVRKDFDKTAGLLLLCIENGEEKEVLVKDNVQDLPPLRNPDMLIGSNDLTSLSYLHEPSVLYNLRVRFLQHNQIYTWCGIVLVAINPFTELDIYGEEIIQTYHSNSALSQLDPHIYAVAEDAFTKLECNNINQSVIVSGESGAGKTVSAKYAMRYFASIAGSDQSNVEARVLASNPIMEAIGNAKTIRNDNSSRFGKYIQILFDRRSRHIMGGSMRTYLLEKSRVTFQGDGERNFHIFYQLCSHAQKSKLDHLGLGDRDQFVYLGSNELSQYDDMTRFLEALDTLSFTSNQINVIFLVVAAILHGGNIVFSNKDDDSCLIKNDSEKSFEMFCQLLDLNSSTTQKWLTSRLLKTGMREIITTPLNAQTAQYGLEALLKFLYEKLFAWIVFLINQCLGSINTSNDHQFIGVLDIYGFELFERNGFEQFCINYANEVLQQQFNLHVFKLEQEEYVREGIDWKFITFTDNQPVIDLIESKPIGILCLLDEECRMPQGSDQTWCLKLFKQIPIGQVFKKPKFGYQNSFIVEHFADIVTYNVEGFLEKNRDTIWEEQIDLLKRSKIVDCLFLEEEQSLGGQEQNNKRGAGGKTKVAINQQQLVQKKKAKATIGHQFRDSLEALMRILNSTEPHYVRCIKPNDEKAAFEFNNVRAVHQLRACGVLETIRISSNGYPTRWSYQDFANRYRVLRVGYRQHLMKLREQESSEKDKEIQEKSRPKPTPRKLVRAGSSFAMEIRQTCEEIIKIVYEEKVYSHFKLEKQQEGALENELEQRKLYQFGKTKIFFRPGQVALLERVRLQKLRECSIHIQRIIRGWLVRRRYSKIRNSVLLLQRFGRSYLARKHYRFLRQTKAAIVIQKIWRGHFHCKRYRKARQSIIGLQKHARGFLARRKFLAVRQDLAATVIQKNWRAFAAKREYRITRKKIILTQGCVRRYLAKRQLRRLRVEARSVEHVTNLNRGLEKKIIELQQRIECLLEDNRVLRSTETKHAQLKQEFSRMEAELADLRQQQRKDNVEIQSYRSQLDKLMAINQNLNSKKETLEQLVADLKEREQNALDSKQQTVMDHKKINEAICQQETKLREEFEHEKQMLIADLNKEKISKQQLLSRCMDLENSAGKNNENLSNGLNSAHKNDDNLPHTLASEGETFDHNLERISVMMRCTELEQELTKIRTENQKLRQQLAKSIDSIAPNAAASLLAEQYAELQSELERFKKERSDLKRVILIEDRITTFGGEQKVDSKYQNDLVTAYKSLYSKMDEQIESKEKLIQKLKNENLFLKCSNKSLSSLSPNSSYVSFDPNQLDSIHLDINQCFQGMFKFKHHDVPSITRYLFYDFDPVNMKNVNNRCDSHIISFIAYMCIRYCDHLNDEKIVQSFMSEGINWLRKKTQVALKNNSIEVIVHVLATAFKLSILIKYYSEYENALGKADDSGISNPIDNKHESSHDKGDGGKSADVAVDLEDLDGEQSLKNFDLTEYTKLLKELMIWVYLKMVKIFQDKIHSLIVSTVLENKELSGMSIKRNENNTADSSGPPSPTERDIHTLFKELSNIQAIFRLHRLDEYLVFQFFKQIYHFIGTTSLNNLLMRKDLCTNERAIEIIYNLSYFEQFLRENNIKNWEEVKQTLDPILQANKLLISNKTEKQIPAIVFTTEALKVSQIVKIIHMYTPTDEEQISSNFIKKLTAELFKARGSNDKDEKSSVLINTQAQFPFQIPYLDMQPDPNALVTPLQATGLACNFKEIEIPMFLQRLECLLEKI